MQICCQRFNYSFQNARAHPLLETSMAGLVRWETIRQVGPGGTSAQHPKNPTEDSAAIRPRTTTAVFAARWFGDESVEYSPLRIGKIACMIG